MKHDPSELQIGWWFAFCCEIDLIQLQTEEDVDDAKDHFAEEWLEDWGPPAGIWPTEEEALGDLLHDGTRTH